VIAEFCNADVLVPAEANQLILHGVAEMRGFMQQSTVQY